MNTPPFWSATECETLDAFLVREDGPRHTMCASMLDGFLAAIVSGPTLVMPSAWLRWVWDTEHGQEPPAFRSEQEAQTVLGLVMAQYNAIHHALNHAPESYLPLLMAKSIIQGEEPEPFPDDWCVGYHLAMHLDQASWMPLLLKQPGLLAPVLVYGTADGEQALAALGRDAEKNRRVANALAEMTLQVHAFWRANRQAMAAAGQAPAMLCGPQPV
ncbi:MAG TPA: YecA family protein, partial [Burkholderiaceae bacterium]|nr:YecA family protein [Burkholderiaceae bacterium]